MDKLSSPVPNIGLPKEVEECNSKTEYDFFQWQRGSQAQIIFYWLDGLRH